MILIIVIIIIIILSIAFSLDVILKQKKSNMSPPSPSLPSSPGCPIDVVSQGQCPTIKPSGTPGWPPNANDKLQKCSSSVTSICIDTTQTTDTCSADNLYKKCKFI